MDKHLNDNELKLQVLLETKSFEELTDSELKFVLNETTKAEYKLNHLVVQMAPTIFDEDVIPVPVPLLFKESSQKGVFYQLPFYYTLIAVAATVAIMLMVLPLNSISIVESTPKMIVQTDTVEIQKEVIKYDTLYQTVEKPIYIVKEVLVENNSCAEPLQEEPRLLNASNSNSLPGLTQNSLENKGVSMRNDNLSSLIVEF